MAANRSKVGYQVKICDIFQTNNNLLLSMEIISPFMALGLRTFSGDSLITKNVFIKKAIKGWLINGFRVLFSVYIYIWYYIYSDLAFTRQPNTTSKGHTRTSRRTLAITSFEIPRPRLGSVEETQCWLEKSTQKVQVHYQEGFSVWHRFLFLGANQFSIKHLNNDLVWSRHFVLCSTVPICTVITS